MRIGMGYDIHRLVDDRKLFLGGIEIPFEKGLLGHSDADVLLHAVSDAILGAASLADIGKHFPDTDPQYEGISSIVLLEKVYDIVKEKGFSIGNIDITLICEEPKIGPYRDQITQNISKILNTDKDNINLKATTMEKLGPIGQQEAIACYAVCLLTS